MDKFSFIKPEYITENTANQTFTFEAIRPELEKYISAVINNDINNPINRAVPTIEYLIYKALTQRTQTGQDAVEARKTNTLYQKYNDKWKSWLLTSGANTQDPNWAQWDIGSRNKIDGKTYNFYITVDFSNPEVAFRHYWAALPELYKTLSNLAKTLNTGISFKTSRSFDVLLNHNDTLKVYYDDPKYKSQISQAVNTWAANNKVPLGTRAYSHGTDSSGTSFGDNAAKALTKALISAINQNKGYTPAQWVSWLATYAPKVIKDTH